MSNSVICTTYFSKKIHPNDPNDYCVIGRTEDGHVKQNDITYIERWYNSINSLKLNGVVFYDDLTDEFIEKYTSSNIKFIKQNPGIYSNNDGRFFCYLDFLIQNKYDNVFLTDGSDVTVVKNPDKIITDYPDVDIFLCKDSIPLSRFGQYLKVHEHFGWENYFWFSMQMQSGIDLINMGVIGGKYSLIVEFLEKFCEERTRMQTPNFNADMWLGQYVFRHLMSDKKLLVGEPFTSEFKKYQDDRKDVYLIHK